MGEVARIEDPRRELDADPAGSSFPAIPQTDEVTTVTYDPLRVVRIALELAPGEWRPIGVCELGELHDFVVDIEEMR
jgi:hypothetical protein